MKDKNSGAGIIGSLTITGQHITILPNNDAVDRHYSDHIHRIQVEDVRLSNFNRKYGGRFVRSGDYRLPSGEFVRRSDIINGKFK